MDTLGLLVTAIFFVVVGGVGIVNLVVAVGTLAGMTNFDCFGDWFPSFPEMCNPEVGLKSRAMGACMGSLMAAAAAATAANGIFGVRAAAI